MAFFRKFRSQANPELVHEAFERGGASLAVEESDETVPTLITETSEAMDDADAIKADQAEVEKLAPGTPLAAEIEELENKALADVEAAKAALADAQEASDASDAAYSKLDSQYKHDEFHGMAAPITGHEPASGRPGGPAESETAEIMQDRERIVKDLSAASAALADADAAKAQADEDLKRVRGGETGPPAD